MIKNKLYNIFTLSDRVQTLWADFKDGMWRSGRGIKVDELPLWRIHYLYVTRAVTSQKIHNIQVTFPDSFSTDAHSILHSSEMGTLVGKLLKNKYTTPEDNLELTIDDEGEKIEKSQS